jgi:hypothetical protein
MADHQDSTALRALAKALAPYLAEIFEQASPRASTEVGDGFEEQVRRLVADLPRDLTEYALVLFEALMTPPHRIDLQSLAKRLGAADGREVSGILLTPLKRRSRSAGLPEPPWKDDRRPGGYRVLQDDGRAEYLYRELEEHQKLNGWLAHDLDELISDTDARRPMPSSVYVWAPEYVQDLEGVDPEDDVESSCLRTDRPGTRAVIYQAHQHQGIVALFDVGTFPEPDNDWNYVVGGRVHMLKQPIDRNELLAVPELRGIFEHIQGRRRIPASAQEPLRDLLITRLPPDKQAPLSLPVFRRTEPRRTRRAGRTARP